MTCQSWKSEKKVSRQFFGKMVEIKEMSFLSTRGMGLMFGNCNLGTKVSYLQVLISFILNFEHSVSFQTSNSNRSQFWSPLSYDDE